MIAASRAHSACQRSGAPYISALVRAWSRDGPPSTRYEARVNGAPAKPINGVLPSSRTSSRTASSTKPTSSGVQRADRGHVGLGLHRLGDDRTDPGLDVEVDAGGDQRYHDVGEEDRGVDPVPAHGLQSDLADQRRVAAGVEHRCLGPYRAVLRQRPTSLTHEPHRRVRDRLPTARQHER